MHCIGFYFFVIAGVHGQARAPEPSAPERAGPPPSTVGPNRCSSRDKSFGSGGWYRPVGTHFWYTQSDPMLCRHLYPTQPGRCRRRMAGSYVRWASRENACVSWCET